MGLTGIIIRAAVCLRRVPSAWIKQQTIVTENIKHAITIFEQSQRATYSVAWIDCLQKGSALGRSLVMLGEHAKVDELPPNLRQSPMSIVSKPKRNISLNFPSWTLNACSVRLFNHYTIGVGKEGLNFSLLTWIATSIPWTLF